MQEALYEIGIIVIGRINMRHQPVIQVNIRFIKDPGNIELLGNPA